MQLGRDHFATFRRLAWHEQDQSGKHSETVFDSPVFLLLPCFSLHG